MAPLFVLVCLFLCFESASASWNATNFTNPLPRNGSERYQPLFEVHSNSTPKFINSTGETANPLIKVLQEKNSPGISGRSLALFKRDLPEGTCAPGTPCVNGACCSNKGICGYSPAECGSGNCISNCNATAPCGQYAKPEDKQCPLNVCCSFYGFCGSTDLFCTTSGDKQCQKGFGSCGPAPRPSCAGGDSTSGRTIGYYEGWSSTRACDKRNPEDIDLTAFSHLNFAFAFFDPKSFQMVPMSPGDVDLYRRFTALKSRKAGLQTWIAVGGWSFNDETNIPNTRTAFSSMVSSSGSRQAFISSLSQFMQTYHFDGVDIDWEYPAADDRGGVKLDKANFVTLLKELRQAFGGRYGISLTLPASYWYLQGFDVKQMQNYVDWMNLMSYDIHGVWDQGNKHTGPFLKPHTNWTEIDDGLDLLWRAGVQPGKINLGLGWYGRSFTLANPSCNTPNGACLFSQGGNPGECTKSAGTLTNAEITRIIAKGGVTKGFDKTAAVKWISWNSDQWVSYDDGETIQLKLSNANNRCLGGKMVWAVDQDDGGSSSTNDLIGIGTANGVDAAKAKKAKEQYKDAQKNAAIASSCYWTFCSKECSAGYFPATAATGQVQGIQADTVCPTGTAHTLCCAPGTTMGICKWDGWRGVGLSCAPVCSDSSATVVARNTNSEDKDCNGGYQAYCCSGFKPSTKTNTANLALIGIDQPTRRDLDPRGWKGGIFGGIFGARYCAAIITLINAGLAIFTAGASFLGQPAEIAACIALSAAIGFGIGNLNPSQPRPSSPSTPTPRNTGVPIIGKSVGQWPRLDFGKSQPGTTSCDCTVTYTCRYGKSWDEVCDNQRWAIDKGLHGATVYHYQKRGKDSLYSKKDWKPQHKGYQALAQKKENKVARCQVDEFPMGSLAEGRIPQPQICRLVNGPANGRQGTDFGQWLEAQWKPCSEYKKNVCKHKDEPPITWAFDPVNPRTGARNDGKHFIYAYGFEPQTASSICFATYEFQSNKQKLLSTIYDHGFRVLNNDPMFSSPYNHPQQNYKTNPAAPYPTEVDEVPYRKRDLIEAVMMGNLSEPMGDGLEASELEDPNDVDCNSCDIVVDDVDTATYINPAYAHASSEAEHFESPVTMTATTVGGGPTPALPPSRAEMRVEARGPIETSN
ncbi:hypothetical protein BCR34DRAFT_662986 [Clohesyomyces aquaticus]|uniref:chitinase n=1 Tax=Clohesyomyces aquaticus TaxID=1231657 RepID=A0A1Y1ZU81_9PLEO|nr:hypothetical protein BCR34DRAFT_662986 [Clohesyomyces aquaticus]